MKRRPRDPVARERRHGTQSAAPEDCLSHFGRPNRGKLSEALARDDLKRVERVYDEGPCRAYAGTGVPAGDHPLCGWLGRVVCRACGSPRVLVVAAETTSTMMGDTYFNAMVRCEACGIYSSISDDDA